MKKTYQTPQLEVIQVQETLMDNASANFGSGSTDTMHAKEGSFDIDAITPTIESTVTPTTDATVTFDE